MLALDIFQTDIHQNNVRSDLYDPFPWNNIFHTRSKQTKKMSTFRDNQCPYAAGALIYLKICNISDTSTVSNINDFLLAQITKAHRTAPSSLLTILCALPYYGADCFTVCMSQLTLPFRISSKKTSVRRGSNCVPLPFSNSLITVS